MSKNQSRKKNTIPSKNKIDPAVWVALIAAIAPIIVAIISKMNFPLPITRLSPTTLPTVPSPIPTITPIMAPTSSANCPGRYGIKAKIEEVNIDVPDGYVAYFTGVGFDEKSGGYFVTFNGPYHAIHTLQNGVYCPAIPANTDQDRNTITTLESECDKSAGGCSKKLKCGVGGCVAVP